MAKAMVKAMIKAKVIGIAVCGWFKGDEPNLSPNKYGLEAYKETFGKHNHGHQGKPWLWP